MVSETHSNTASNSVVDVIKNRWLNIRRKRFWAIVVVLLYTVIGFFLVPYLIKSTLLDLFQKDLGRSAQVANVELNPYVLSLRIEGVEVSDTDDVKLISFDEFFVNFQLSSLFNWAWTFRDVRLIKPYVYFERYQNGQSRIDSLLADFARNQPAEGVIADEEIAEGDGLPHLLIYNLSLDEGHVRAKDNVPPTPVETQLSPIKLSIKELSTIPDHQGWQDVTIQLPHQASLSWSGSLTVVPLRSKGELVLKGLHLDPITSYLEAMLPLESLNIKLSSQFKYNINTDGLGELSVAIDDLSVNVNDLSVSGLSPTTEFVSIPKMQLLGGTLRYPDKTVHINSFSIENPQISAWVNENGSISLLDLVPVNDESVVNSNESAKDNTALEQASEQNEEQQEDSLPWQISLDQFNLNGGDIALADKSLQPNAKVDIKDLAISVSEINNNDNSQIPFNLTGKLGQGGNYQLSGSAVVLPELSITANTSTENIPLSLAQPYLQQFARIKLNTGVLNSNMNIALPAQQSIKVDGSIQVASLAINDSVENQPLLGWESFDIEHFTFSDEGLYFSQIKLNKLFARMMVNEDQSTNVSELMIEQKSEPQIEKSTSDSTEADKAQMKIVIDGIRINDSAMKFADFSLPLPFATDIHKLNGSISIIATNSKAPSNIKLEGQVNDYGLSRIKGTMSLMDPIRHTDMTVVFKNLDMSNLSPYTVEFAGNEIDTGKLDLSLGYTIEKGRLNGTNDIILSDLELGDKIDHPDAADLPLGLAIALLKDSNGVIDIDLPVKGDMNDPEFAIGGVIWDALSTLIIKIVASPFNLLGSLIGVESDDLGEFEFLAGRADLTPPQLEKVAQLERALQQRQELAIEISGISDRVIDTPALQVDRLEAVVNERKNPGQTNENAEPLLMDEETTEVLQALFTERFPATPLENIETANTIPAADNPKGKPQFDSLAYATDLWNQLVASEEINDQDLTSLASARAETIKAAFLASGQFQESRVEITDPEVVETEEGEWVVLKLDVAVD